MNRAPIGFFDSGVGGLTVARELIRQLPGEDFIYLADTARVPYGSRDQAEVRDLSLKALRFLAGRGVKAVVLACGTSTAAHDLTRMDFPFTVIGVIKPGAAEAVRATRNRRIGVIATQGTISSGAYPRAIHALAPDVEVFQRACPCLVPLVEAGQLDGDVAREAAADCLDGLRDEGIDTLVLGCTHFPLFGRIMADLLGDAVTIIDPAAATIGDLRAVLAAGGELNDDTRAGRYQFYVTANPVAFRRVGEVVLGHPIDNIALVDFIA